LEKGESEVITITIEGAQGSGKTSLAFTIMLWLSKQKRFFSSEKWEVSLWDEENVPFKRKPYEKLPDILVITKQKEKK
jgi:Ni2+-binding GTPase involved in maturation of urease and hydrogenase